MAIKKISERRFIAAIFIVAPNWKTTLMLINRPMCKQQKVYHTADYYLVVKKNKLLLYIITQVSFVYILLSKRSQANYCIYTLFQNWQNETMALSIRMFNLKKIQNSGEDTKQKNYFGKQFDSFQFLIKLNTHFPYNPAIPLHVIYPSEMKSPFTQNPAQECLHQFSS